jgi:hypothetical protein
MVVASTEKKEEKDDGKLEIKDGQQEYPAKGQASFKDVVTDEQFEQLKKDVSEVNGRKVEWIRAPGTFLISLFYFRGIRISLFEHADTSLLLS